jgi:RimJ/RimL family protein N-acetyltransferase
MLLLRPLLPSDLPIFFEHQRDPVAAQMAGFPSREHDAFMAHWAKIMTAEANGEGNLLRTIVSDGQVAGNIVCFPYEGKQEVGYWLGREFWGQGLASRALAAFLQEVTQRPLHAYVARHNPASRRVLEKCGFRLCAEDDHDWLFRLEAAPVTL